MAQSHENFYKPVETETSQKLQTTSSMKILAQSASQLPPFHLDTKPDMPFTSGKTSYQNIRTLPREQRKPSRSKSGKLAKKGNTSSASLIRADQARTMDNRTLDQHARELKNLTQGLLKSARKRSLSSKRSRHDTSVAEIDNRTLMFNQATSPTAVSPLCPLRARNESFVNHQLSQELDTLNTGKGAYYAIREEAPRRSQSVKRRAPFIDLGLPSIDQIGYLNIRSKKQPHQDCKSGQIPAQANTSTKACLELQRKVDRLEHDKRKMALKIKSLQQQLANQAGACCCEELRQIHADKEENLQKIAETWKLKSFNLAGKYFKSLQSVREEHTRLQLQTYESIDKLRLYQQQAVA